VSLLTVVVQGAGLAWLIAAIIRVAKRLT
jgi:hypothetical protein